MPKRNKKPTPETADNPKSKTSPDAPAEHSLYAMANELLEKSVRGDWQSVLSLGRKMTHTTLGHGYFALAVTLKKLYWSLVPHLNEGQARKYVLRTTWSLARAKRENDTRFLIHRDPEQFKLRKQDGKVTQLVKFHNFDPDSVVPPAHELETIVPAAASLILQDDDETDKPKPRLTNHHDHLQPPHISLAKVSHLTGK